MRRRDVHKHDSFDRYLSRLLNSWVFEFPLPVDGRVELLTQAASKQISPYSGQHRILATLLALFRRIDNYLILGLPMPNSGLQTKYQNTFHNNSASVRFSDHTATYYFLTGSGTVALV